MPREEPRLQATGTRRESVDVLTSPAAGADEEQIMREVSHKLSRLMEGQEAHQQATSEDKEALHQRFSALEQAVRAIAADVEAIKKAILLGGEERHGAFPTADGSTSRVPKEAEQRWREEDAEKHRQEDGLLPARRKRGAGPMEEEPEAKVRVLVRHWNTVVFFPLASFILLHLLFFSLLFLSLLSLPSFFSSFLSLSLSSLPSLSLPLSLLYFPSSLSPLALHCLLSSLSAACLSLLCLYSFFPFPLFVPVSLFLPSSLCPLRFSPFSSFFSLLLCR